MTDVLTAAHPYPSYAQAGEDRVLHYVFDSLDGASRLRYADVGASAPAGHNNTYLFYALGGSGVLVEADPMYREAYQEIRPRDVLESVAVVPRRMREQETVTFFRMRDRGWSTVSPAHAKLGQDLGKGDADAASMTVPCRTLDEILGTHFPDGVLDILSLDVEGVDVEILQELDLRRFTPKAVVIENAINPFEREAGELTLPGYVLFASTFVNSIYLERQAFERLRP
jgi:FkbM family methyltransferase